MKIDKLDRLLSALSQGKSNSQNTDAVVKQPRNSVANTEAVKFSDELGSKVDNAADRQARLDQLKEQVRSGEYNVSSKQVAVAFAKELLI